MSLLTELRDPALEVPEGLTPEKIGEEEVERLARMTAIATIAVGIPRRLGEDASPEEMAIDKKRGRRVSHALGQCLSDWNGKKPHELPSSDELRTDAATVLWLPWWDEHQVFLQSRLHFIATWQIKTGDHEKFAKSAVVRYTNEIRWVTYALRE